MANDMERSNIRTTLTGTAMGAIFTAPLVLALQRLTHGAPAIEVIALGGVGLTAGAFIFKPQLVLLWQAIKRRAVVIGEWFGFKRPPASHRPSVRSPGAHRAIPAGTGR